jgi:hypothetical protein
LENSEKSITGSDIDVLVQKRLLIDTERTKTYTVNFNMPLAKTLFTDNILHTYPEITVFDSAGVARNVFVEEIPTVNTGIDSIEILSGGINYQSAPTVTIVGDGTGAKATALVVGGRIQKITVTSPGENYSSAIVELSGGEGTGGSVRAILQSRKGTLRSFYYKTSREKVIVNPNFGTIDYDKGIITINSLRATAVIENDYYEDGYLTLTVPAENENIFTQRNRILSIDYSDARSIQLVAMAE